MNRWYWFYLFDCDINDWFWLIMVYRVLVVFIILINARKWWDNTVGTIFEDVLTFQEYSMYVKLVICHKKSFVNCMFRIIWLAVKILTLWLPAIECHHNTWHAYENVILCLVIDSRGSMGLYSLWILIELV